MGTAREAGDRRAIRSWILYDWANSAFATTILAAVLPVYYKTVACSTLPGPAVATKYWTLTLSVSLAIVAVLAPVLGTVADVTRGKKRFLGIFLGLGVAGTALLTFAGRGEWLLVSVFFVLGRVGFASANVFYDSLLPHVAAPGDRDRVSAQGYALGYLGGGLLLAANAGMLLSLPARWGYPLVFLSVAVWWGLFALPLFRFVPEPPGAPGRAGVSAVRESFGRLAATFRNLRRFRQLFRFLLAFLVYNDGIGTIIGVAAIYGAELGFGARELILAVLLVQFAGIPFSIAFGGIASGSRRSFFLSFVVANVVLLPLLGATAARLLPANIVGAFVAGTAERVSRLDVVLGLLAGVEVASLLFAGLCGRAVFGRLAARMDAKRGIALALLAYAVIAAWGVFLDAVVEFWFLAFLISVVQGGSQALSRSLYAALAPAALSGEFFGLFSVMSKFSAIVGPLIFVASVELFGGSRPAMLGVMLLFVAGLLLLGRVDVAEGRRVAEEENERALHGSL